MTACGMAISLTLFLCLSLFASSLTSGEPAVPAWLERARLVRLEAIPKKVGPGKNEITVQLKIRNTGDEAIEFGGIVESSKRWDEAKEEFVFRNEAFCAKIFYRFKEAKSGVAVGSGLVDFRVRARINGKGELHKEISLPLPSTEEPLVCTLWFEDPEPSGNANAYYGVLSGIEVLPSTVPEAAFQVPR